ncbi:hypothetical protein [Paenibacillus elgii]|uniref:hypothetical protein n=1 Tax=Paenibacillus elgii TaxID=189691 RepID=UPI0011B27A28|nr:hypothetical protein [Paenibacillus elgii]
MAHEIRHSWQYQNKDTEGFKFKISSEQDFMRTGVKGGFILKVEPNFPDTVVVLVKHEGKYTWYVSEKELWIMDLLELDNAFRRKFNQPEVTETEADYEEREGCEILSEKNIAQFQEAMKEYKVSYTELTDYFNLYSEVYLDGVSSAVETSFYLDFDNKIFYSFFKEPGSYEQFVPTGWRGIFEEDVQKVIPENAKRTECVHADKSDYDSI